MGKVLLGIATSAAVLTAALTGFHNAEGAESPLGLSNNQGAAVVTPQPQRHRLFNQTQARVASFTLSQPTASHALAPRATRSTVAEPAKISHTDAAPRCKSQSTTAAQVCDLVWL